MVVDSERKDDEAPVWRDMFLCLVAGFVLWNDWASDGTLSGSGNDVIAMGQQEDKMSLDVTHAYTPFTADKPQVRESNLFNGGGATESAAVRFNVSFGSGRQIVRVECCCISKYFTTMQ